MTTVINNSTYPDGRNPYRFAPLFKKEHTLEQPQTKRVVMPREKRQVH